MFWDATNFYNFVVFEVVAILHVIGLNSPAFDVLYCSVFSRHGIPSFPSILIVNQTSRVRYHGPKDFLSLVQFYQKITGKIRSNLTVDVM